MRYRHSTGSRIFCLIVIAILAASCTGKPRVRQNALTAMGDPVPVVVTTAIRKTVPDIIAAIGNVEAYSTIQLKSQVEGQLARAYFSEGQFVKRDDMLFLIDPRSFEAAAKEAEANLARDRAQSRNADLLARRSAVLIKDHVMSQQEYDQNFANAEAYKNTVRADEATLENARIQLGYCYIRSPIDGRIGSMLVHPGNLIKANADTAMAVINQIEPIYVTFSVPEERVPEIKRYMAQRKLMVTATVAGDEKSPQTGVLTFLDNAVDSTSGTIKLKATFTNSARRLWPGQFARVSLLLTEYPNSLVVPAQAVQEGQSGQFVFVVDPNQTASHRPIVTGISVNGETVVERGLNPGETVVTDGQMRLFPGAKVEVKNAGQRAMRRLPS